MKKICAVLLLLGMILTCNIAYAVDAFDIHIRYAQQIWKYMDQVERSNKPKYLGYEYCGPDGEDFGLPEHLYSLAYKTSTTVVVVNYSDKQLKNTVGAPYFFTTSPAHSIGKIKVGSSEKSLANLYSLSKKRIIIRVSMTATQLISTARRGLSRALSGLMKPQWHQQRWSSSKGSARLISSKEKDNAEQINNTQSSIIRSDGILYCNCDRV